MRVDLSLTADLLLKRPSGVFVDLGGWCMRIAQLNENRTCKLFVFIIIIIITITAIIIVIIMQVHGTS